VTGANGFLGRFLVTALLARGDTVRAMALPSEDATWLVERGVNTLRGDIRDTNIVREAIADVEAVFHLAGMMGVWRPLADYHAVNVKGVENVCRTALNAGVRRIVHVSSTIVYGFQLPRPATEDSRFAPFPDPYAITKAQGDRLVQRMISEEHLPAVIIRPDQFFGPGDRLHFAKFADRLRAGKNIVIGSGANTVPLIFVTDVVQGLLLALDVKGAEGRAYNLSYGEPMTQEAYLRAIAQAVGAPPPRIHVPYSMLYSAAYAFERAATLTHSHRAPPVTPFGVAFLGLNSLHSHEKARRELGFEPRVPLSEGVRRTAEWYLHQDAPISDLMPAVAH
jgi:nucleoside-diphosphate-sugar epimerase